MNTKRITTECIRYGIISIFMLMVSCSSPSVIIQFTDYLNTISVSEVSYNDVVERLGAPIVKKEFEKEIVASWIDSNLIPPEILMAKNEYGREWVKYYDAGKTKGEKIIITFDKSTMKIIDWKYKEW